MRIYDIQSAFARGELSPRLHARTDIDHYRMGLLECTNWYVLRQGALRKRPGSQFIGEVKSSASKVRLIPFTFSTEQAYVLEFGDRYFRVFANGGRIEQAGMAVEVVTPYLEAELFDLKFAQSADTLYVAHPKHPPMTIGRTSDTAWTIDQMEFLDGPYLAELEENSVTLTLSATGGVIPAMTNDTTPSGIASASAVSNPAWHAFDQNDNTGWSANTTIGWVEYNPPAPDAVVVGYLLQAGSAGLANMLSTWAFQGFDGSNWVTLHTQNKETGWQAREWRYFEFKNTVAYQSYRISFKATDGGGVSHLGQMQYKESPDEMADVILTADGTTGINKGQGFLPSDLGRPIRLQGSDAIWRWFKITGHTSATVVAGKLYGRPLLDLDPIRIFRMGAWSAETGYPGSVSFFEERLVWARTDTEPQKVWGSRTFAFDDHGVSSPLVDDDAFSIEIASDQVNEIKWISEATDLLIGTSNAIRTLGPSDTSKAFSATNVRQRRHTTVGSASLQPARIGGVSLYADQFAKGLRELFFSFENNAFTAPELTILSDHLLKPGIVDMAYAEAPDSIVWIVAASGDLISLTFERDQRIVGMARHALARTVGGDAVVESVAVIPGTDESEVWLVVRRTIGGTAKRYVERLSAGFEGAVVEDAAFLDSFLKHDGAAVNTVSGLNHLEGETVAVLADGTVETATTVTGGQVALADGRTASKILVGLGYDSKVRLLPPALAAQDGSHLGRLKSVPEAFINVHETLGLKAGREGVEVELDTRKAGQPMDQQVPLLSGSFKLHVVAGWRGAAELSLLSDKPLPATVRAVTRGLEMEP